MSRKTIIAFAFAMVSGFAGAACGGGYADVDGYDAVYVDGPPAVNIDTYPRYRFRDGYVYDVNGHYYHQHGGRWVSYRALPREAVREERWRR
jgi:hypothetical protein